MARIEKLRQKVVELYESKHPSRADWADLLYETHVFVVAEHAKNLSERFGLQNDLAEAAAILHDIADAVTNRSDIEHESKSIEIAHAMLSELAFASDEIALICEDILPNHSCRDGNVPTSLEGKVMATADAVAHLDTDFYVVAEQKVADQKTPREFKAWVGEKIERDFNTKIFFDEIREELSPRYDELKKHFELQ